jgi:hypothetical protein
MNKTKSLLDVIKHKTGETFDVDLINFDAPLVERTMNHTTYGKMLRADHILVGFEAEWPSGYIKGELARLGLDPDRIDLDDARRLDSWEERTFTRMFDEWRSEQRDDLEWQVRNNSAYEASEHAYSKLMDYYEDELTEIDDDGDATANASMMRRLGMSHGELLRAVRDHHDIEDDDAKIDESDILSWLKDEHESEIKEWLQTEYGDEWTETEDEYIENEVNEQDDADEDTYFDNNRSEILSEMGINTDSEPTYSDMENLKEELEGATGIKIVEVSEDYDGTSKRDDGYEGYYLETDSGDAELISPPQTVSQTLTDLKKILEFIQDDAPPTTDNGLHVTMSVPGMEAEEYDVLKILMFLGEDHLLQQFEREGNTFTKPHRKSMLDDNNLLLRLHERSITDPREATKRVMAGGFSGEDIDLLVGTLYHIMTGNRYRTFNLSHLFSRFSEGRDTEGGITFDASPSEKPRVEFRIMGNEDYSERYDDIQSTILRYAYIMDLATNPKAEREEYAKKLYKFFSALMKKARDTHGDEEESQPKLGKALSQKAEKFKTMFAANFISGSALFKLGGLAMAPNVAMRYMDHYIRNDIHDWMDGKQMELFMIVATIMKASTYAPNNVNLREYAPFIRMALQRGKLGTKAALEQAADKGLAHSNEYDLDGGRQELNREDFKAWVLKTAEEYNLI